MVQTLKQMLDHLTNEIRLGIPLDYTHIRYNPITDSKDRTISVRHPCRRFLYSRKTKIAPSLRASISSKETDAKLPLALRYATIYSEPDVFFNLVIKRSRAFDFIVARPAETCAGGGGKSLTGGA